MCVASLVWPTLIGLWVFFGVLKVLCMARIKAFSHDIRIPFMKSNHERRLRGPSVLLILYGAFAGLFPNLTHSQGEKLLENNTPRKKFQIFNLLHIEHAPWRFWYFVKLKASAQKCLFHLMIFWRKFAVALCLVERNRPFRANLSVCLLFWLIKGLKC